MVTYHSFYKYLEYFAIIGPSWRKHGSFVTITNGAAWSVEFQTNRGYFDTRKKSLET